MNGATKVPTQVPFSWQRVAQQMSQEVASLKLELAVTSDALEAAMRRVAELEEELEAGSEGGVDSEEVGGDEEG